MTENKNTLQEMLHERQQYALKQGLYEYQHATLGRNGEYEIGYDAELDLRAAAHIATLESELAEAKQTIRDREAELLRCRTHETASAIELDNQLDDTERKRFKALADELAEARAIVEQSNQLFVALKRSLDESYVPIGRYTILRTDADAILTKAAALAAAEGKAT